MRKLVMWNIITLDGYFEGAHSWDLSFHEAIWCKEMERLSLQQLQMADYLVFGRVTYEGMAAYWTNAGETAAEREVAGYMNSIPKLVFSNTLKTAEWHNTRIVAGDATREIQRLKDEGGKDMYVFGSANLAKTFMNSNVFDEYRIGVAPVILGSGRPLFKQGINAHRLALVSSQQLGNGGVVLRYTKNLEGV